MSIWRTGVDGRPEKKSGPLTPTRPSPLQKPNAPRAPERQSPQRLTCDLGYAVPRAIAEAGLRAEYDAVMGTAQELYQRLAPAMPEEASYVVPNGFNRRVLLTLNLREAFHLCELRGAATAHFSARRTAGQIYAQLAQVHPLLASFMRCRDNAPWQAIEQEHFAAVA